MVAGCDCSGLDQIPACTFSINAFGTKTLKSRIDPPEWFKDTSESINLDLPPATACVWPYEQMYGDDVERQEGKGTRYNAEKRLKLAEEFFRGLAPNKTLIFYYSNTSNPFSEDPTPVYVVAGVSRLKQIGDIRYFPNVSPRIRDSYGGYAWQMPITSHFPDEGFALPYQRYMDDEEVMSQLLFIPEHSNNFKYAAKHIGDDDALIYVERFLQIVSMLEARGDDSENWAVRRTWLQTLLTELWVNRGPYPGLAPIMIALDCGDLAEFYYDQSAKGNGKAAAENILKFVEDRNEKAIPKCTLSPQKIETCRRNWQRKLGKEARELAKSVLCRVAITAEQAQRILIGDRSENGIYAYLDEIEENPYILSEQYIGNDPGDEISFSRIDHAVLPSPELGLEQLHSKDDWRRLRALMCDELKRQTVHAFVSQETLLVNINTRLEPYPEWKKEFFNENFVDYDKEEFEGALTFRRKDEREFVYLSEVREDETLIETHIRELISRPAISLAKPYRDEQWENTLFKSDSDLARIAPDEYKEAIKGQRAVCERIFRKPVCIVAGSAGTGKTTVIKAILDAIKFTSGNSESFCLLAPTGKAADRIREKTGEQATTIHSLLTKAGWMNPNFSLKRSGGRELTDFTTVIVDEASMIDLNVFATLLKALNFDTVKRLILVGDPNQLPPIGRGKVFSDIIQFVASTDPEAYGKLETNIRQMENRVCNKGTGIIELASLYVQDADPESEAGISKADVELFLKEIHESDEQVRPDLRVVAWKDADELAAKLVDEINKDCKDEEYPDLMKFQVVSPYRGELFGTEVLNTVIQQALNSSWLEKGNLAGITFFDKVIQYINRAGRKAYRSYNKDSKQNENVDVFNGEMGTVRVCGYDWDKVGWSSFRLEQFQVAFERKPNNLVDFKGAKAVENNLELGYAISVHKAQGSEFDRVYFVLPKNKQALLSTELLYTGITRAQKQLTLFVEQDFTTLLTMRRPEKSRLALINSSVFEFVPLHEELLRMRTWYEEGKIHSTLTKYMVRSKSEVIVANLLFANGFTSLEYETPLFAPDGTFYLPDFTVKHRGQTYYWEHLGLLDQIKYKHHWEEKAAWYQKHFPGQLITTLESPQLTEDAAALIEKLRTLA